MPGGEEVKAISESTALIRSGIEISAVSPFSNGLPS